MVPFEVDQTWWIMHNSTVSWNKITFGKLPLLHFLPEDRWEKFCTYFPVVGRAELGKHPYSWIHFCTTLLTEDLSFFPLFLLLIWRVLTSSRAGLILRRITWIFVWLWRICDQAHLHPRHRGCGWNGRVQRASIFSYFTTDLNFITPHLLAFDCLGRLPSDFVFLDVEMSQPESILRISSAFLFLSCCFVQRMLDIALLEAPQWLPDIIMGCIFVYLAQRIITGNEPLSVVVILVFYS